MTKHATIKHFFGLEIKDAAKGEVEAVVATLGVIDKDGDIIRHRAVAAKSKVVVSDYGHSAAFGRRPAGKALQASMTVTAVDDLQLQLKQLLERINELRESGAIIDDSQVEALVRVQQQAIEFARESEALDARVREINREKISNFDAQIALQAELLDLKAREEALTGEDDASQRTRAELQERIKKLEAEIARLQAQIAKNRKDEANAAQEALQRAQKTLTTFQNIAQAAYGISTAIFGANEGLTRMIGGTAQVLTGFQQIVQLAASTEGGFSALFSSTAGIASMLPAIGAIVGGIGAIGAVFGAREEDPAARALREALDRTADRLEEFTSKVGELVQLSVSGVDAAAVRDLRLTRQREAGRDDITGEPIFEDVVLSAQELKTELRLAGVSMDELRQLASDFGITFANAEFPTAQELTLLQQFLRENALKRFSDSFAGQQKNLDVLKSLNPDDFKGFAGLTKELELFAKQSPALAKAFEGIDLTSEGGPLAVLDILRQKWDDFINGRISLEDLGGLTPEEFAQFIEQFAQGVFDAMDQAISDAINARAKQRSDLQADLDFRDIDDPFERLQGGIDLAKEQFGDTIGKFFEGIDITAEGGLAAFNDALSEARSWLYEHAEALGLTDAEIEEMISTIYGLETSADAAEASIKSLADTLSKEFSRIDVDAAIFGKSAQESLGAKLGQLGISSDLSSEGGRSAAIEALRALARVTDPNDQAMLQLIAGLIGDIQRLASDVSSAAGSRVAGGSGSTSAISSTAQQLTERTGDRMADYLGTLVMLGRENNEMQQEFFDLLTTRFVPPSISPPVRPSLGAAMVSGFGRETESTSTGPLIGQITFNLSPGSVSPTLSLTSIGRQELRKLATDIGRILGEEIVRSRRIRGDVSQ